MTPRESQIAELLEKGGTAASIAETLRLKVGSVKRMIAEVRDKQRLMNLENGLSFGK